MSGGKVAVYVEPHVSLPYVLNLAARHGSVVSAADLSATDSHRVVFVDRDVAAKLCDTDSRLFSVPAVKDESVRDVTVSELDSPIPAAGVYAGSSSSQSSQRSADFESDDEKKDAISGDQPVKKVADKPVKKAARKKAKKATAAKRKRRGDDRGES